MGTLLLHRHVVPTFFSTMNHSTAAPLSSGWAHVSATSLYVREVCVGAVQLAGGAGSVFISTDSGPGSEASWPLKATTRYTCVETGARPSRQAIVCLKRTPTSVQAVDSTTPSLSNLRPVCTVQATQGAKQPHEISTGYPEDYACLR